MIHSVRGQTIVVIGARQKYQLDAHRTILLLDFLRASYWNGLRQLTGNWAINL